MKVISIARKVKISKEEAEKKKLLANMEITPGKPGTWTSDGDYWTRQVMMPAFVEEESETGGVPDVGNPTIEDLLTELPVFVDEHFITPKLLAEILNNGLYLHFAAKSKPKATTAIADIQKAFFTKAADIPALLQQFTTHIVSGGDSTTWLKDWYSKNPV